MKKPALLLWTILVAVSGFAQTVVSPGPGIEVRFKRCIAAERTVDPDFLVTNHTGREAEIYPLKSGPAVGFEGYETVVYDDEGNVYRCESAPARIGALTSAGKTAGIGNPIAPVVLPNGVPKGRAGDRERRRIRHGAPAREDICFRGTSTNRPYRQILLKFKNIPIIRQ